MTHPAGFRLPNLLLPRAGVDLARWAVIACDQYTSEPDYWRRVAAQVGDAPSTLQLIFPEVLLGTPEAPARLAQIQAAMRRYRGEGLLREHAGAVYVERRLAHGVRRGLMLELDLEHYDYSPGSTSLVRPTEGTIVARLAPRIEVRRQAELELPHILVLIDDPACTVVEPLAAERAALAPLYDTELMLGGGHVAGWAVDEARGRRALQALAALAAPAIFEQRYGVAPGTPPMLFAVGDGNHSLATAKACWEEIKAAQPGVGPEHPARFALVEVENIHDPALAFAPIHRLLLGVGADVRAAFTRHFGARVSFTEVGEPAALPAALQAVPASCHAAGLLGPGGACAVVRVAEPAAALAVATFQAFVDDFLAQGGAQEVDYVHGDETLQRLVRESSGRSVGLHLAGVPKGELLRRVVHEGPLPRKTFSMGEADEKRFYMEARLIR